MKKSIIVSACLLGTCCRYDGNSNLRDDVIKLGDIYNIIPVCPEVMGGLNIPRPPAEIVNERVITNTGTDVTKEYIKGAETALKAALQHNAICAVLKERSPSCGNNVIYDGTFTHTKVAGDGIFVRLLKQNSIPVYGETEVHTLLNQTKEELL